jgi:hypothetical protein
MDAPQTAAGMSVGQALQVLWPYLTAAAAVVAFLVGWVRSLAVKLAAYDTTAATQHERLERLEQTDEEQSDALKEQKTRLHDRIDEVEGKLLAHAGLEDHPVGRVRREALEKQLAEVSADVKDIKTSVNRLVAKAGA